MIYCAFLALVLVLTTALVLTGHGEFKDYQWAAGVVLAGIGGLLQEPPRGRGRGAGAGAATSLLLALCLVSGCQRADVDIGMVRVRPAAPARAASEPVDQVTFNLKAPGTITCPGMACLGASSSSGWVEAVSRNGDRIAVGEARSLRQLPGPPPSAALGDLYAQPSAGGLWIYGPAGWDQFVLSGRQILCGPGLGGCGDFSATRTIGLVTTGVTPGTYTLSTITVDAYGRLSAASSAPPTGVTPGTYTLSTITVGADGRITAASSGSAGGPTIYHTSVADGGASAVFSGTLRRGRIVGRCELILTAGGGLAAVKSNDVAWSYAGGGATDEHFDNSGLLWTADGTNLIGSSPALFLGFSSSCYYWAITQSGDAQSIAHKTTQVRIMDVTYPAGWSETAKKLMRDLSRSVQKITEINWSTHEFSPTATTSAAVGEIMASGHMEARPGGKYRLTATGLSWTRAYPL
jgi:hypothetical protein